MFITSFIMFLFMNLGIFCSVANEIPQIAKENILYVGGSGPGNYSKIQDAINNAHDGDTIFVYSGTYYEYHILVDKTITLIGEDKQTTIIDGNNKGDILYITADNVYLSGFTFQRSGGNNTEAIHQSYCNKSIITDNIIQSIGEDGIWLFRAHNNTITNNTFLLVKGTGLMFTFSSYNVASRNIFINNGACIGLDLTTNTTITKNTISNNQGGIYLSNMDEISNNFYGYNTITMNNIANNSYGGIFLDLSFSNNITMNNIVNNKIGIWIDWSLSNKIEKNNIIGNTRQVKFETAFKTYWNANYWGKPRLMPKPLFGISYIFPFPFPVPSIVPIDGIPIPGLQFDWHPARKPYNISCFT